MKKLLAIALLTIYLFNLIGYSLLFQCLIDDADTRLVKRLDNNIYNDKDLLEVKVALNMPYLTATENGIHYNYVKRKISGDTLYLLCLPNFSKTQLYNAKAAYAKENSDAPTGKKSTEPAVKKQGAGNEYNCTAAWFNFWKQPLSPGIKSLFICPEILPVFIQSPTQPPDVNC